VAIYPLNPGLIEVQRHAVMLADGTHDNVGVTRSCSGTDQLLLLDSSLSR
jgi:hypothetical protein